MNKLCVKVSDQPQKDFKGHISRNKKTKESGLCVFVFPFNFEMVVILTIMMYNE